MNFTEITERLGKRESRKVGNNTYLIRLSDDSIALRLHATNIIVWHADGRIIYDNGGWATVTTKQRLNYWGPVSVFQRNYEWFVQGSRRNPESLRREAEAGPDYYLLTNLRKWVDEVPYFLYTEAYPFERGMNVALIAEEAESLV